MKLRLLAIVLLLGSSALAPAQNSANANPLPTEEREALIALYNATGGPHWKDKSGWLGPVGTECEWFGVTCDYPAHLRTNPPFVSSLALSENDLAGAIPAEVGRLAHLEWLTIFGNNLTGSVPEPLIERWLAGPLHIAAEAHLLTSISNVDYEWSASSLLCGWHRIILRSDGTAVMYTTRCRNASREDRATYCEVKEGQVGANEFAILAWTIERSGFFNLKPEYYRNITDSVFKNTRVTRDGKVTEVSDYAGGGPLELWNIQHNIEGVWAGVEVQKTARRATCPKW